MLTKGFKGTKDEHNLVSFQYVMSIAFRKHLNVKFEFHKADKYILDNPKKS